jgi:transcription-repair coupling factor (superfamily II helicase)
MVLDLIRSLPAYNKLIDQLKTSQSLPGLGLARATRLPVLACLYRDLGVPVVMVTGRSDQAMAMVDELGFWLEGSPSYHFPEPTPLFYEKAIWGSTTRNERLKILTMFASTHIPGVSWNVQVPIVVTTVRALMQRTLPRRDFLRHSKVLRARQAIPPDLLQKSWFEIGYQPADTVLEPGYYSRRGGLLDIWSPAEELPIRLDFFGDEIETIRRFDPRSQRTVEKLEAVLITPAREYLPGKAMELGLDLQTLDEFMIPQIHPAPASLLDYLPAQALVLCDDVSLLGSIAMEIEEQALRFRKEMEADEIIPDSFPIPYQSWSELSDHIIRYRWFELGHSTAEERSELARSFEPAERFGGRIKPFMEYLEGHCMRGEKVTIVSRQVARLKELWGEQLNELGEVCAPEFREGTLGEGWVLNLEEGKKYYLLTDSEIFGWERPKPRQAHQPTAEAPEATYGDLRPGDWVVHVDYGIGRLQSLVKRTIDKVEREFLWVEYAAGDALYVPVHQADRLSKYIGVEGETPSPTRLGTTEWTHAKQRVREAVQEVAHELLELYARRQVAKGYAFQPDNVWQKDLEASFPYIETKDQLLAIQEVKKDMETAQPMDRLLCGDVGYGKTEVALRAAFKAVMDGKQVAVLVPTTVLAQQHFDTFRMRLAPFPVEVEMLSRFRHPKAQDEIIKKLIVGSVDIVIGTHRLLQQDVLFKDLGLVIIDEEQRFGVTHKEHFKKLRTEVDVLTLTATPIPRTLYMALTGVRDISTINTPPEERLPIVTHIGPYSPRLVRQAILRELERGGQVFFVHNRVQSIQAMAKHLRMLVPEARLGIGHGQMYEDELASVMAKFTKGEIDILLSTSIIESGLDIPNANTLIVDRGDAFGLAQLYQLRGRVGRGAQRAYAYFFKHRKKSPTPEGQERLETIAEYTQLGSVYSIAMRDLEMRGAGELLGTRQHGYMAAVGFHLYTRLLAQAVSETRKQSGIALPAEKLQGFRSIAPPVTVDLPISIGFPTEYVTDQNLRLRLYRRLANTENEEELQAMVEEFTDRFGPMPEETANLFFQVRVKLRAESAGLASITLEGDQMVLRFPPLSEGVKSRNLPNLGPYLRAGKNAYWMQFAKIQDNWRDVLLTVMDELAKLD